MQNLIESLDICCFDFDPIRTVPLSINLIWLPARLPISRPMWIMQREKKRCLRVWWRRSCMGLTSKPSQAVCISFRGSFIQKMSWFAWQVQKFYQDYIQPYSYPNSRIKSHYITSSLIHPTHVILHIREISNRIHCYKNRKINYSSSFQISPEDSTLFFFCTFSEIK